MKSLAAVFMLVFSSALHAQGDAWDARQSSEVSLIVPGGRERASQVTTMNIEQRCPPGDTWTRPKPEMDWNVLELGLAVNLPLREDTEPQLYSRYTCQRPIDRPGTP